MCTYIYIHRKGYCGHLFCLCFVAFICKVVYRFSYVSLADYIHSVPSKNVGLGAVLVPAPRAKTHETHMFMF